jgi:hypothetical protein
MSSSIKPIVARSPALLFYRSIEFSTERRDRMSESDVEQDRNDRYNEPGLEPSPGNAIAGGIAGGAYALLVEGATVAGAVITETVAEGMLHLVEHEPATPAAPLNYLPYGAPVGQLNRNDPAEVNYPGEADQGEPVDTGVEEVSYPGDGDGAASGAEEVSYPGDSDGGVAAEASVLGNGGDDGNGE